mmetsp:Transcript_3017/g.4837  ORF Transcript_3017/g.4837 Transcript_3017/m.4837 type:complete len:331 (-) Transcript_3017:236-1228(-)
MRCCQAGHGLCPRHSGGLGQGARHHGQGLGELPHGVLVQARRALPQLRHRLGQLGLEGAAARHQGPVPAQRLHRVHSVVHRPGEVVDDGVRGGAQHHGGQPRVARGRLLQDQDLAPRHLPHLHEVAVAHLVRGGRAYAHQRRGVHGRAQPPQLPLRGHLHAHDLVLGEEVQGHLGDGAAHRHHAAPALRDRPDGVLHRPLLALVVVEQLLGGLDEHGALGLGGRGLQPAPEHRHLGVGHALDGVLRVAQHHHAPQAGRGRGGPAAQLGDADVVHVELRGGGRRRHHREAGARHQRGQQILEALLLGHDHGPQHAHQRCLVTDICDSFDFQ